MHFGLCCLFNQTDIKFKTYTKAGLLKLSLSEQRSKVQEVVLHNFKALQEAINYCHLNYIDSYRISSDLIPHFEYITDNNLLPENMLDMLTNIKTYNIRLSMHPGQHCVPGSPNESTSINSFRDLKYHYSVLELLENTVPEINIHLGGTYGDKVSAKQRFIKNVISWDDYCFLTIENDELSYGVEDCLEVARELNIPVVFDLHHHRCYQLKPENVSKYTEHELFLQCKQTWIDSGKNYMRMHISSPKDGYSTPSKSRAHSDYIDIDDLPEWLLQESEKFEIHLDIEAKHKETAIRKLKDDILVKFPEYVL